MQHNNAELFTQELEFLCQMVNESTAPYMEASVEGEEVTFKVKGAVANTLETATSETDPDSMRVLNKVNAQGLFISTMIETLALAAKAVSLGLTLSQELERQFHSAHGEDGNG